MKNSISQKKLTTHHSLLTNTHVEGDWSGGAFLLVAGAIAGSYYSKRFGYDVHTG